MLGRQRFNLRLDEWSSRRRFSKALRLAGIDTPIAEFYQENKYAETMFRKLGFAEMQSLDASSYEGADLIWDLNKPVSADLRGQFGLIVDGGTLEHIFDVAQTMSNMADMLAPGGRFVSFTPFNGYPGHGFYQFSPELVWTYWKANRGFTVRKCYISDPDGRFIRDLTDTREAGKRIQFSTGFPLNRRIPGRPLMMCYEVEKPMEEPTQRQDIALQSDYEIQWALKSQHVR